MFVTIDEISWFNNQSPHLYRCTYLDQVDIGMGYRDATRKEMKPNFFDLIKITDRTVRHRPRARPNGT